LGVAQADDRLVYAREDQPAWGFGGQVTDDGGLLVVHVWEGTEEKNRVYTQDLTSPDAPVTPLLDERDAGYSFVARTGTTLWFLTNLEAPKYRLLAMEPGAPEGERWQEVVPESDQVLEDVDLVGERLVLTYISDAHSRVEVRDLTGALISQIDLPGIGSAWGFDGEVDSASVYYGFTGFTDPPSIYRFDVDTGISTLWKRPPVDFDPDAYETTQVFYESLDGTQVPMFITHKAGLALDGTNPTLLYGYGGFNVSLTPWFSTSNLVWMELGGVYAMPNLRGGGEYGEEWHAAGTLQQKQNVFDDFIAAGEWLIANGYTRPDKLAIRGGSNGGLLVGACLLQRPDLFGAALPEVGVLDMLRYHLFTIGWAWASDYGTVDDSPEMFRALLDYSPVHNATPGKSYPSTLIITADHDDRVVPAHSFKFAAALQHAQAGPEPTLIRIETRAGHGAGKSTEMRLDEAADKWAFLVEALDVETPAVDAP
jgi:prolyl oligopeptidase